MPVLTLNEAKTALHARIDGLTDEERANELLQTVSLFLEEEVDEFDRTSPEAIRRLEEGLRQAEAGQTSTTDQLLQKIKEWSTR